MADLLNTYQYAALAIVLTKLEQSLRETDLWLRGQQSITGQFYRTMVRLSPERKEVILAKIEEALASLVQLGTQFHIGVTEEDLAGRAAAALSVHWADLMDVHSNKLGRYGGVDVRLGEDTALQPDLLFISNPRAGIIQENWIAGSPDLVVEVLSPSTAAHDRATKLPIYAEAEVAEVWLIDSQAKTVEVLNLQGKKYFVEATLAGDQTLTSNLFPGWQLPLSCLFDFRGRF